MDDPGGQRLGLAPIELANKSEFDSAFSGLAQPLSDYTFACNYIWGSSLKLYWMRSDNHLCIFANGTGDLTLLVPPIPQVSQPGHGTTGHSVDADMRDCLGRCFEVMDAYNDVHADRGHSRIEYVSDELLERINGATIRGPLNLGASPMSGDYLYDMQSMITLAGGSLKSKRHARSKFLRDHPDARVALYSPEYQQPCFDLLDLWQHHGDETHVGEINEDRVGSNVLRQRDTLASKRALQEYGPLGLTGMVLLAGEKVIGFTIGESIGDNQASILIEKTHHDYDGAAQFIFSEFCRLHWSHLPLCNAGDDWGLSNLRFTKQSYRPVRLLNKSVLTRSSIPLVMGYMKPPVFEEYVAPESLILPSYENTSAINELEKARLASEAFNQQLNETISESIHSVRGEMLKESADSTSSDAGFSTGADFASDAVFIEPATMADLDAILSLEDACFAFTQERFCRRQIRGLLQNPRATVLVARSQSRIVGWTSTLLRHDRAGKVGRIYAVGVHPDMQGRHIGQLLLERGMDRLIELAPRRIVLEVRQGNHPAIRLYQKMGFVDQQFLADYYGQGRHGYRMHHPLTSTHRAFSHNLTQSSTFSSEKHHA